VAVIRYRITGISPLLMDNAASMLTPKPVGARAKAIPTPETEAESGAYRLPDGALYFPTLAFRQALIDAGTGRRIGKRGATSVLSGTVFLPDGVGLETPLVDPDTSEPLHNYVVDIQRAVIRTTKAGVARARPRLDRWAADIGFEYDDSFFPGELLTEVFTLAGTTIGVGNYRPQKRGIFGRFQVKET
jgi:hypothetical protein